ncbi:MAG: CAP domain-containing protein [Anaeromyxobacter sp.]
MLGAVLGRLASAGVRPTPASSLALAARELADRAAGGDPDPVSSGALRSALSRAAAFDPQPWAVLVTTSPSQLPAAVASRVGKAPATAVGVGVAARGERAWAVVVLSRRRLDLGPFPRDVAPGSTHVLAGTLGEGLRFPRVYATSPSGRVSELETGGDRAFRARVGFSEPGRWLVEVMAEGADGPEMAGLLAVSAGGAALDAPFPARGPAGARGDDARAVDDVLRALNELRRQKGLGALELSPALSAVARMHSEAMRDANKVAHVLPGTGELGDRLRRAKVPYVRAYENVGRAPTALEAHHGAEESPAHLANMLRPAARIVGLGLARGRIDETGSERVYLTQIFVEPPDPGVSPLTPDARVREALWKARARSGNAPPLTSDARLDALAREAARSMLAADDTDAADLSERALGLQRKLSAVDVFVASGPDDATRSKNLPDPRFGRVGVGVATGDSARFGTGRMWIVVIYTD